MTSDQSVHSEIPTQAELLQYRELFHFAPIGIIRTSVDGKILAGNKAFAEILGYAHFDEYALQTSRSAFDLYEDPLVRQQFLNHLSPNKGPLHFESRWRKKDGSFFNCRLHVRASTDEAGRIRYFEGFIEDISRQKEIEAALLESAERYRSVFENTGTATIIIESDTIISLANERAVALTGYSKDELEGKLKWPALIAKADDLEKMMKYHVSRRRGLETPPIEYEFTLKDKTGKCKEVFLRVDMIAGTDSSVASILDITSLKDTRRNLLASESRLSGILEAFEGFIYICDSDHKLLFMNRKQNEAVSGDKDQPCYKRLYGLETPCPWCDSEKVFQGMTVKYEFQSPINGRWYYAVSSPVYAEENNIRQKQTVILDIHARKSAENALKERENYLAKENLRLRENIRDRYKFGAIIGKSLGMQKVYELILRAAATNANVIIYGESGTGKELVAGAIHEMSDRSGRPFVPVNCAAIPANLMESEFFGYRKGAFTGAEKDKPGFFAQANQGTLFLDELGEIDETMQVKLLRVLEGYGYMVLGGLHAKSSDVRIIAATNRNLRALLDSGRMREDFFYRIHIIPISIPPLRDRLEDIPLLTEYFLKKYTRPGSPAFLHGHELEKLMSHDWPGNVRELENTLQRFINLNILDFPQRTERKLRLTETVREPLLPTKDDLTLREATKDFEREFIRSHLIACRWNRTKVASILGIQRKTLYLKMKQLELLSEDM